MTLFRMTTDKYGYLYVVAESVTKAEELIKKEYPLAEITECIFLSNYPIIQGAA